MSDHLPKGHPVVNQKKIGVLLLNLGTPDATDYWSMRRYLGEFLSDRRVIEVNRVVWWLILNLIILTTRPGKSGAAYDKIWDTKANDSPLRVVSRQQAEKLQQRLGDNVIVDFAMRYGNPSTETRLKAMQAQGCDRILLLPLYPQYSAPTTATANDSAFSVLKSMRWQPAIRTAPAYFDQDAYLQALAQSVSDGVGALDFEPELIVTSYHGMPEILFDEGGSLSLPMPEDDAPAGRTARLARRALYGHLSEPLRHRGMASALYGRGADVAAREGHQEYCHSVSGVFGGLSGNPGGARDHRQGTVSWRGAERTLPIFRV